MFFKLDQACLLVLKELFLYCFFYYACMFFVTFGNKYIRSANDLFALLPISCT